MWIEYKHSFAWGWGDSGFVEVPELDELKKNYGDEADENDLEGLVASYLEDFSIDIGCSYWSDKYRGFDAKIVDHPSSEWLMKKINLYRGNADFYSVKADQYQDLLDEVGFITKEDSDV